MRCCFAKRRSVSLLAVVGTIARVDCRSSPSPETNCSHPRVRSMASSMPVPGARYDLETVSPKMMSPSSSAVAAACTRGGATEDDPRWAGGYARGDEPPPARHSSSPYNYDARESRGRRRSGGVPRAMGYSRRGVVDPRNDRRGGGPNTQRREGREWRRDGYDIDDPSERSNINRDSSGDRDFEWNQMEHSYPVNFPANEVEPDRARKGKKWFTWKKDGAKILSNKGRKREDKMAGFGPRGNVPIIPPPPPPPPPPDDPAIPSRGIDINPAETERTPIHYMFPTVEAASEERKMLNDKMDNASAEEDEFAVGDGSMASDRSQRRVYGDDDDEERLRRLSPRRDAVTAFMSTRRGALQVRFASVMVGAALGGFIGKSVMKDPLVVSTVMAFFMFVTVFLRNDYGELSRALGLALVLTVQRTRSVRKDYPTLPHLKAMSRLGPRKPFPPAEEGSSLWKYEPVYRDDPEFTMTYALLAMALVGSFCGGNIPVFPAWMGGIGGAIAFAFLTMGSNARGDLGRCMGMRVVGLARVVLAINHDLRILSKAATVGGLIFDKVMIMDRKHQIKDKIVAVCKWGYDKATRTAEGVKEEMLEKRQPERW